MLGITAGTRKKEKPRMKWVDDIKSVTGVLVNDLNQLVKDEKKWDSLVNKIVKKKKMDQYLIQGEGNGKPFL